MTFSLTPDNIAAIRRHSTPRIRMFTARNNASLRIEDNLADPSGYAAAGDPGTRLDYATVHTDAPRFPLALADYVDFTTGGLTEGLAAAGLRLRLRGEGSGGELVYDVIAA